MRPEIKLIPPKLGRTPFYQVRGTYLEQYVDRSTQTSDRKTAKKVFAKIKRDIECGAFAVKKRSSGPTFSAAALEYMKAGGERRFMAPILIEIGMTPLADINQAVVDDLSVKLYANATAATRNRQVHTPIAAVLRHKGLTLVFRRPAGAQGRSRKHWLRPEDASALLEAAWTIHPRFAALLTTLLYTGCRLSEALSLQIANVHLKAAFADLEMTKNGEPQRLHLPPVVVQAIRLALAEPGNASWASKHKPKPAPRTAGSVFCLTKSGALYDLLKKVEELSGVSIPDGVAFHVFRHTFGAWTREAGGRLEETGRWKSRAGAKAYDHYEITDAAKVADQFPGAIGALAFREVG